MFTVEWSPERANDAGEEEEVGEEVAQRMTENDGDLRNISAGDVMHDLGKDSEMDEEKMEQECPRLKMDLEDFQSQGVLDFGSVYVVDEGAESDVQYEGEIVLVNRGPVDLFVTVDRFTSRNGFAMEGEQWEVEAGSSEVARVLWKPTTEGGVRQSVTFSFLNRDRRRVRVGAFVSGVAKPVSKKLTKGRMKKHMQHSGAEKPLQVSQKVNRQPSGGAPSRTLKLQKIGNSRNAALMKATRKDLKMRQILFDDRWMEKQEKGFASWINFVMTPSTESDDDQAASTGAENPLAELARKQRQASLQRRAFMIIHSSEIRNICYQLDREIASGGIAIRADKDMFKDLGLRKMVLDMIFRYQRAWLRLGLETVIGANVASTRRSLKKFATTYLLGDPELDETYKDTKKGLFDENPEYKAELRKRSLRRFLHLVLFLDRAKKESLIDHPGCLFQVDSPIKSSSGMLVVFAKEFLAGEGNVLRHLQHSCDYTVSHKQSKLDEYDFSVTNLSVDLRDGIRLTRAVELLTGNKDRTLSQLLRLPAVSRLQKLHNADVALMELEEQGLSIEADKLTNKDIVDGHRTKTLSLLWKMIMRWRLSAVLPETTLREEIERVKALHGKTASSIFEKSLQLSKMHEADEDAEKDSEELNAKALILLWCQAVCAHHGLRCVNLTTSLATGKALCLIVHHYHPKLLRREDIQETTVDLSLSKNPATCDPETDWIAYDAHNGSRAEYRRALAREKANFKLVNECAEALGSVPVMLPQFDSENIPEERTVMLFATYLCSRLLISRDEIVAACKIQRIWIQRVRMRRFLELGHEAETAAVKIGNFLRMMIARASFIRARAAATKLQAFARGSTTRSIFLSVRSMVIQAQRVVRRYQALKNIKVLHAQQRGAVLVQAQWRGYMARINILEMHSAAIEIQAIYRGHYLRSWLALCTASSIQIQAFIRGCVLVHPGYLRLKRNAIILQSLSRRRQVYRDIATQHNAACIIQAFVRGSQERENLLAIRNACMTLQGFARGIISKAKLRNMQLERLESSCIKIQTIARMYCEKILFRAMKVAAVKIQSYARMDRANLHYLHFREQTIVVQGVVRMRQARLSFVALRNAVLSLQGLFRAAKIKAKLAQDRHALVLCQAVARGWVVRRQISKQNEAAKLLQSVWKAHTAQVEYRCMKLAAVRIQSIIRMQSARLEFECSQLAAVVVQTRLRAAAARGDYLRICFATIKIQAFVRGRAARFEFCESLEAIVLIQAYTRQALQTSNFQRTCRATVAVQAFSRMLFARKVFVEEKYAAIQLQSFIRGRRLQGKFAGLKAQVVLIQSVMRSAMVVRNFKRMKSGIVRLQALIRGTQQRKNWRKVILAVVHFQAQVRRFQVQTGMQVRTDACVFIQTRFRTYLAQKNFVRYSIAVLKIQSAVRMLLAKWESRKRFQRAVLLESVARMWLVKARRAKQIRVAVKIQGFARMVSARNHFEFLKDSVAKFQAVTRGYLERLQISKDKTAIVLLQSYFRAFIMRKRFKAQKKAAIRIQRFARRLCMQMLLWSKEAIKIQALARGYLTRKARSKELRKIMRRIAAAKEKATDEMTLGARTHSALDWLLRSKNLASIRKACETLEVSTQMSSECADAFLNTDAADVLFALVQSCNRSLPHVCVLQVALRVLVQVGKHDKKNQYARIFANKSACAASIMDILQLFRDRMTIVSPTVTLLLQFCSDSSRAINYIIKKEDLLHRLQKFAGVLAQKSQMTMPLRSVRRSGNGSMKESPEAKQYRRIQHLLRKLSEL